MSSRKLAWLLTSFWVGVSFVSDSDTFPAFSVPRWFTGVPLLVVGAFVVVRAVYDNNGCWIAYVNVNHMWIVKAPIITTFFVSLCFYDRSI